MSPFPVTPVSHFPVFWPELGAFSHHSDPQLVSKRGAALSHLHSKRKTKDIHPYLIIEFLCQTYTSVSQTLRTRHLPVVRCREFHQNPLIGDNYRTHLDGQSGERSPAEGGSSRASGRDPPSGAHLARSGGQTGAPLGGGTERRKWEGGQNGSLAVGPTVRHQPTHRLTRFGKYREGGTDSEFRADFAGLALSVTASLVP